MNTDERFPTDDNVLNKAIVDLALEAMSYGRKHHKELAGVPMVGMLDRTRKFLDYHFAHEHTADPRQFEKDKLTFDTYARAAVKTESIDFPAILARHDSTDSIYHYDLPLLSWSLTVHKDFYPSFISLR